MSSNDSPYASTTSQLLPALHHASPALRPPSSRHAPSTLFSSDHTPPGRAPAPPRGKAAPAAHGPDPPSSLGGGQAHPQRLRGRQQREYAGIADAFRKTWSSGGDGGPRAFCTGLVPDAARSALDSFLFFLFYEWFRGARLARRGARGRGRHAMLGALEELAIGVVAGACAKALTTPVANVAARKEASEAASIETAPGEINLREIVASIRRDKGVGGLWSGYSANLLLTLNPSITFFLQEFLKGHVSERRGHDLGAGMSFLLSATSKAISTLVTYPLQVARARLQVGIPIELPIDPEPLSRQRQASVDISPTDTVTNRDRDLDREVERKLKATRAVQEFAQQGVFGTMAQLVRNEGVGSLYDGLRGELLNSFLGHGTTMVVKEVMHRLLFRFYFFALGVLAELRQRRASRQGHSAPEVSREASSSSSSSSSSAPAPELAPELPPAAAALPAPPTPSETPKPPTIETTPTPASSAAPAASEHSPTSTTVSTPISTPAPAEIPEPSPASISASISAAAPAPAPALPPSSLPVPIPVAASSLPVPIPAIPASQIQAEAPTRVVSPAQIQGRAPSKIPLPRPVSTPQEIPAGLRYRLEWDESRKRRGSLLRRGSRAAAGAPDYGINVVANLIDGTHRGLSKDRDRN